jgi:hypothetical protein
VTTLLIVAAIFLALWLIGPKLIRVWDGLKTHHRQVEAVRKIKEEDFPD